MAKAAVAPLTQMSGNEARSACQAILGDDPRSTIGQKSDQKTNEWQHQWLFLEHLTTFPDLTANLISKHLPKTVAAVLGHQDQEAKHLRSAKGSLPDTSAATSNVLHEEIAPQFDNDPSHQICVMLFDKQELLKSHSNQTGPFPIPST